MSAVQALCYLMGVSPQKLSREENLILEAELFIRLYGELQEIIKGQNKDYFRLMKFNTEKESAVIEASFIRCIINDIISTEEYTLPGIAYYSGTTEDVIEDVIVGRNASPSLSLARKIIELHRSVRPELYRKIMEKITHYNAVEVEK